MKTYIHQLPDWPAFRWDREILADRLAALRHRQGRLIGRMEALGFELRQTAVLDTLTQDVLKTSEIEGEILNLAQVRSSVARRLGIDIGALQPADRHVDGVVEMMLDATQGYRQPLTEQRLFGWHASLFPTGRSGLTRIVTGGWRDDRLGPMQVVSGPVGKERVHYEAPPAARLEAEMSAFLAWFNLEGKMDPVLKAALAHLWFVTIHPFDDGNGRVARAIADLQLARSEDSPQRFYSMSAQIGLERSDYYEILEKTQSDTLDVTAWIAWFLACLERAMNQTRHTLGDILAKTKFWEAIDGIPINSRQRLVLTRLLGGFEGNLTSTKYAKLAKCSQDTAHRDILDLLNRKILLRTPERGRNTSYSLLAPGPT